MRDRILKLIEKNSRIDLKEACCYARNFRG